MDKPMMMSKLWKRLDRGSTARVHPAIRLLTVLAMLLAILAPLAEISPAYAATCNGLSFATSAQTSVAGVISQIITVQAQQGSSTSCDLGSPVTVALSSNSTTGIFYSDAAGTAITSSVTLPSGTSTTHTASFYYQDTKAGTPAITVTGSGLGNASQQETITAATATHLAVSGFTSPTTAGTQHSVTVTAKDAYSNTATGYRGQVTFSSSDLLLSPGSGLPANYTFVGSDNGAHTFNATLKTAGSQAITATDTTTSSITGSQTPITVNSA